MERITITAKINMAYNYTKTFYYQTTTMTIYKLTDESGKVYVWHTSGMIANDADGCANEGDTVKITASVKGESEYNGEPQTELQRVKLVAIVERIADLKAKREAEREAERQAQRDSIKANDFVWMMPYKQYKEHYADCETVLDSFRRIKGKAIIGVIIREGRLKANGTRGMHYSGYRVGYTLNGHEYVEPFRAVSGLTAIKQCEKKYPEATDLYIDEIIQYTRRADWLDA